MERGVPLGGKRQLGRPPDVAQIFAGALGRALGPAVLLRLHGGHRHGQFGWGNQSFEIDKPPAALLGAVAEVEVFGERVRRPSARVGDGTFAPHARRAVEIDEVSAR